MSSVQSSDVRSELGNPSTSVISDAKLTQIIVAEETLFGSAARAARILATHFSLKADKTLGKARINYSQRAKLWFDLSDTLQESAAMNTLPYAGGIYKSDKESRDADTNQSTSYFFRDMLGGDS